MCNHEHGHQHGNQQEAGCCGGHAGGGQGGGHHCQHDVVAGPGDELVTCTVRGTSTLKSTAETAGLFRDVEGERYYFCCRRCQDLFDAERLASSPAA